MLYLAFDFIRGLPKEIILLYNLFLKALGGLALRVEGLTEGGDGRDMLNNQFSLSVFIL